MVSVGVDRTTEPNGPSKGIGCAGVDLNGIIGGTANQLAVEDAFLQVVDDDLCSSTLKAIMKFFIRSW